MIEARELTKRYGGRTAVDALSFTVRPGPVTGFLGPEGAGRSTTLRMILGLDAPGAGTVTVGGRRYDRLPAPLGEVGSLLDATAVHGGRTARRHLLGPARSHAIPRRRVEEVLETAGLAGAADRRAGELPLGTAQRLGTAAALLGGPGGRRVTGPAPAAVGQPAREHALALHELTPVRSASEDVCTAGTTVAVPGFREALAFEWTKFASLRSTPWTTPAVTAVVVVMLPSLFGPLLGDLQRWIVGATPAAALQKLSQTSDASPETAGSPGAWPSPGLVTAYTVLALLVAAGLLRRRDV